MPVGWSLIRRLPATDDDAQKIAELEKQAICLCAFGTYCEKYARRVRSQHPVFKRIDSVYYHQDLDVIIVEICIVPQDIKSIPLFMLGKPVQLVQSQPRGVLSGWKNPNDWLKWHPDAKKVLTSTQIEELRVIFPRFVGIRVLLTGICDVLYSCSADMQADGSLYDPVATLDDIPFNLILDDSRIATTSTEPTIGTQVRRDTQNLLDCAGCLGLRLDVPRKGVRFTVATHCFVDLPRATIKSGSILRRFLCKMRNFITKPLVSKLSSPLGQQVFLAGRELEAVLLGSIDHTYDAPSTTEPFPSGFRHDLSLVNCSKQDLTLISPMGLPAIEERFASTSDALQIQKCFVAFYPAKFDDGRLKTFRGAAIQPHYRSALIAGLEYRWHENLSQAFLWRTVESDDIEVTGTSGSVLCIGDPSASRASALCFQNGQTLFATQAQLESRPRKRQRLWSNALKDITQDMTFRSQDNMTKSLQLQPPLLTDSRPRDMPERWSFKWGFQLPEEILQSRILCELEETNASTSPPGTAENADVLVCSDPY